jgi:ADP-heptose:LPS heptosyltransferase
MKAIGFNAGQYGDLAMCTVAARALKRRDPDCYFTMGIGNRYGDVAELFHHEDYINNVHVWDSYNEWPNQTDMDYIMTQKFDVVYNAMPQHTTEDWYLHRHQVAELCLMHKLPVPNSLKIELSRWWDPYGVAPAPYVCFSLGSSMPDKVYNQKMQSVLDYCKSKHLITVQLAGPNEDPIGCDTIVTGEYWKSVVLMADAELLVTVDTGMAWFASGYNKKVVGLYGYKHYPHAKTAINWMPINPFATYLERDYAGNIPGSDILTAIESKLS